MSLILGVLREPWPFLSGEQPTSGRQPLSLRDPQGPPLPLSETPLTPQALAQGGRLMGMHLLTRIKRLTGLVPTVGLGASVGPQATQSSPTAPQPSPHPSFGVNPFLTSPLFCSPCSLGSETLFWSHSL